MRSGAAIMLAALAMLTTVASAPAAPSPAQLCQETISSAARRYFDARAKALARCRNLRAVSGQPADCTTAADVVAALAQAETRLTAKLTAKCPGATVALTDLGLACAGASTVGDVVACIRDDVHGPRADELIDAGYGDSGQVSAVVLRRCQRAIGRGIRKAASARARARAQCARALTLVAGGSGSCPDERTFQVLDRRRAQLVALIEARCDDAQVLDAALEFGGECGDDRPGVPAAVFQHLTFERSVSGNAIPARTRLARCLAATTAVQADTAAAAVHALSDPGPFDYGVAAGDATETSFIAWTRTTDAPVTLEVATTASFAPVAVTIAGLTPNPAADNTIKVEVSGLSPATQYYYRFTAPGGSSRTGRIRTAPLPSSTAPITFAFTGDSNAYYKPFAVLEGITRDDPDLFLYIGDTVYADDTRSGTGEAIVLADYHLKYRENREDRALRDLMANVGTDTIWDDHEVTNDFYGVPFGAFGAQIVAGNQAFRDWMPIREDTGDPMRLYRSFKWGEVAEFFLIDPRQYRDAHAYVTEPACLSGGEPVVLPGPTCVAEINNPARTYLGAAQKAWLKAALATSTAKWKFIMNGPPITPLTFLPYDRWEGYEAERAEMLEFFRNPDGNPSTADAIPNVIFLTTDLHAAIYNPQVANPGPSGGSIREIIAGAIGMDSIYRLLPGSILPVVGSLPSLFPTIQFFDIDRRNYVHVRADTTQATFTFRDNTGSVLKSFTLAAE